VQSTSVLHGEARAAFRAVISHVLTPLNAETSAYAEELLAILKTLTWDGRGFDNPIDGAEEIAIRRRIREFERIVAGIEKKSRVLSKEKRRRVAYHEMGHALVAASLPGVDPVQKVSIIPRGVGALGYTMQRPPKTVSCFQQAN
jgi:hypothetical protein